MSTPTRKTNHSKPGPYDNCQTPPYAITPILKYIAGHQTRTKKKSDITVWESAAGDGYLTWPILSAGYVLIATDNTYINSKGIIENVDFFSPIPFDYDIQITNPPYSIKYDWLERSYELGKPFALLLPVETLGSSRAQRMFLQYGINVLFLDSRVNFKMPNKGWSGKGAQFPVAWFTWKFVDDYMYDRLHMGFEHIDPEEKRKWHLTHS